MSCESPGLSVSACALPLPDLARPPGPGFEPMNPGLVHEIVVAMDQGGPQRGRQGTAYVVLRPPDTRSAFWDQSVQILPVAAFRVTAPEGSVSTETVQACEFYALSLRAIDSALACIWSSAQLPPDPWSRQEARVSAVGVAALRSDLERALDSYRRAAVPPTFEATRGAVADSISAAMADWPDVAGLLARLEDASAEQLDQVLARFRDALPGLDRSARAARKSLRELRSTLVTKAQAEALAAPVPVTQ